jgi:putative spermidine/putrescine transport system ATP-binding protein/spermidine/putrescine transport system ATP-binding protein
MTVAENVAFGLEARHVTRADATARILDALQLVQLSSYADRMPAQLSGGQQQRVALARCLVVEPALLLLDEPLGALDKSLRESMQVELRALQQRLGITTIMVTHDQDEALTMADRVAIMRAGRLEQLGTPMEVYQTPASRFVASFIGVSNFFRGKIDRRIGGAARVVTPTGIRLTVDDCTSTNGNVTVALRPEAIMLQPVIDAASDHDHVNTVTGTVEQVVYRGFVNHIYLRLPDGETVVVFRPNRTDYAAGAPVLPGMQVRARWAASSNRVVRDDASA